MAFSLPEPPVLAVPLRDDPTLAELRAARAALEHALRDAVAPLLRTFHQQTGVSPRAVDVDMQALWPTDITGPKHVVIGVRVVLDV